MELVNIIFTMEALRNPQTPVVVSLRQTIINMISSGTFRKTYMHIEVTTCNVWPWESSTNVITKFKIKLSITDIMETVIATFKLVRNVFDGRNRSR